MPFILQGDEIYASGEIGTNWLVWVTTPTIISSLIINCMGFVNNPIDCISCR